MWVLKQLSRQGWSEGGQPALQVISPSQGVPISQAVSSEQHELSTHSWQAASSDNTMLPQLVAPEALELAVLLELEEPVLAFPHPGVSHGAP